MGRSLIGLALSWGLLTPADGFDDALALAGRGEFVEALRAADSVEDPLRRTQALVWTYQQAGDWVGADRLAHEGLEAYPDNPWLLERRVSIALTLGRSDLAPGRLREWENALSKSALALADLDAAKVRLASLEQQAQEAQDARARRNQGVRRAQIVTVLAALAFAFGTAMLLRPRTPAASGR